ncbi:hypothetical protein R1sor_023770 [Riccia sorocarpa]|uniref:RNA polymerase Rpb5 N-terminal domain-containing protein n=1 Tax=Riccia sorocarpa TaxID=122646 RepID=A0ABD3GSP0_9MARC
MVERVGYICLSAGNRGELNLREMLRDRDYLVADVELAFTKDQFREKKYGDEPKREDLVLRKTKRSNPNEQVFVLPTAKLVAL